MKSDDLKSITIAVTKKWTKQRKRELRDQKARANRRSIYSKRICQTNVAWEVIPKAYAKVSDDGRLPASQRQIYYASRNEISQRTGRPLKYGYFANKLLRRYLNTHPETVTWLISRDDRGSLIEPHTNRIVPMGTLRVDHYLQQIEAHVVEQPRFDFEVSFPTLGFQNRYRAILYIEKEGFNPLFKHVRLADRYDIAIVSCKGQSVIAARKLVDHLCHESGVPLLILHDFDKYGFEIAQNLTEVSWSARESNRVAYEFQNAINYIDLGLRLEDVEAWNLEPEPCDFSGEFDPGTNATLEEQHFLRRGQRAELNAFTSADFVMWVESTLKEHGFDKKLVPDAETLAEAYRRTQLIEGVRTCAERARKRLENKAQQTLVPDNLESSIRSALNEDRKLSWDAALTNIVRANLKNSDIERGNP